MPTQPDYLTNESVQPYVGSMEEQTLFNERLDYIDSPMDYPTGNALTCPAVVTATHEGAFLVWVECTGGLQFLDGTHSHTVSYAAYYVTDQVTERATQDDIMTNKTRVDGDNTTIRPGYRVLNFDNTSRHVTVTIGDSGSETRTFEHRLEPNRGVQQAGLPYEFNSTYPMMVQTDGETTTNTFTPAIEKFVNGHNTVIFVLPDGSVVVAEIPPREGMGTGKW